MQRKFTQLALLSFAPLALGSIVLLTTNPFFDEGAPWRARGPLILSIAGLCGIAASWTLKTRKPLTSPLSWLISFLLSFGLVIFSLLGTFKATREWFNITTDPGVSIYHGLALVLTVSTIGLMSVQSHIVARRMSQKKLAKSFRFTAALSAGSILLMTLAALAIVMIPSAYRDGTGLGVTIAGLGSLLGITAYVSWIKQSFLLAIRLPVV